MNIKGVPVTNWISMSFPSRPPRSPHKQCLFLCVADHFEPDWGNASDAVRLARVDHWEREYPKSIRGFSDSTGRPPQHTFFYPLEKYHPLLMDRLARICHRGLGDVEVHLHHDQDTPANLRERLLWFKETLYYQFRLLQRRQDGNITYGFIHGNWALCNSRPDRRWCGVDEELTILRQTGCYADFTMPSAPDVTQTRSINRIYYALDAGRASSHHTGPAARVGRAAPDNGLLMIPGPLVPDWGERKLGILPRLENADLHADRPPAGRRLKLWERANVTVEGRPNWKFVKLHTHGAKEANAMVLLGEPMRNLHRALAERAARDSDFRFYYVTAREMAALVRGAEGGIEDPEFILSRPQTF